MLKRKFISFRYKVPGSFISDYIDKISNLNENKESQKFVDSQMRMLRKNYQQIIKIVETNKHDMKISELEKKTFSFSFHTY